MDLFDHNALGVRQSAWSQQGEAQRVLLAGVIVAMKQTAHFPHAKAETLVLPDKLVFFFTTVDCSYHLGVVEKHLSGLTCREVCPNLL